MSKNVSVQNAKSSGASEAGLAHNRMIREVVKMDLSIFEVQNGPKPYLSLGVAAANRLASALQKAVVAIRRIQNTIERNSGIALMEHGRGARREPVNVPISNELTVPVEEWKLIRDLAEHFGYQG